MQQQRFTPSRTTLNLLARRTRTAIAAWLADNPCDHEGDPVIAIQQRFFVEPIRETIEKHSKEDLILCGFEDCKASVRDINPLVLRDGVVSVEFADYVVCESFAGYRTPHFHLCHDFTYLKLVSSGLTIMAAPGGSYIDILHFRRMSLMISMADPAQLGNAQTGRGNWPADWRPAACTLIWPRCDSQHERIAAASDISMINEHLDAFFRFSHKSFSKTTSGVAFPRSFPADDRLTCMVDG